MSDWQDSAPVTRTRLGGFVVVTHTVPDVISVPIGMGNLWLYRVDAPNRIPDLSDLFSSSKAA